MRTTALILGLIAAVFLFLGGCSAYVTGGVFSAADEALELGLEDDRVSPEDVQSAGAFALFVSILLFVAAGLAKVALRISLALFVLSLPLLLILVLVDPTSLFAVTYYLGLILIGVCTVLMFRAWRRAKKRAESGAA